MTPEHKVQTVGAQICADRGCVAWRETVMESINAIINPKDGAIGQVHEKINGVDRRKVSISQFTWTIAGLCGIFAFIIGGITSYTYTSNETQDRTIASIQVTMQEIKTLLIQNNKNTIVIRHAEK